MFNYEENIFIEKSIAAPADRVWKILSLPGGYTKFHPFLKEHTTDNWNGIGSKDHVTYYSNLEYDREVLNWIEGIGYDLKVSENGKNEIKVIFRITPVDNENCKLGVTINAIFLRKFPFPIRWALLKFKLKPVFVPYLHQVENGLAYYAETGKYVKRNQFGSHPLMSPEF